MKKHFFLLILLFSNVLMAQKANTSKQTDLCDLNIIVHGKVYKDAILAVSFSKGEQIELRFNKDCLALKKADLYVSSFEVEANVKGAIQSSSSDNYLFTEKQKILLMGLKPGSTFTIKNIVVKAADGYRNMPEMQVLLR